jgi:hypothetical protein
MIITAQPHLQTAAIDTLEIEYTWDDWNVHPYFRPGDPELAARMLKVSHRGRAALSIAIGEWIVHRLRQVSGDRDHLCRDYIEALWAWVIDWRYAIPFRPDDSEWKGPVLGALELVLVIANDAFEEMEAQGDSEACPAWMSQLARHVLPSITAYEGWLEQVVERLEQHYPWEYDEDDLFAEGEFRGAPVPRELFDVTRVFDPAKADELLAAFLEQVSLGGNPLIRTYEELEEVWDEGGEDDNVPFLWPPREE